MSSTSLPAAPQERTLVLSIVEHPRQHQETRFTVTVCERNGLRAICHIRSLFGALLSLAPELSSAPISSGPMAGKDAVIPNWSLVSQLVRTLHDSGDEHSTAAANWLELAFAWAVEMSQKFQLAQERVEILDLLVQELIKLAKPLSAGIEGSQALNHWLNLVSTYEGRQELAPHIELAALRELAGSMAETVSIVNSWVAGTTAQEAASHALWRTGAQLRGLGYQFPDVPPPSQCPVACESTVEAKR